MNKYLRLFRLQNGVMGFIGLLIAIFIAAGYDMLDQWVNIVIGGVIVVAFVAGGNSLNDYVDAEIDKTAHPDRPVPSGELTARTAMICGYGGLAIAVVLSLFLRRWEATAIVLAAAVMMIGYEIALKQRGFVGNLFRSRWDEVANDNARKLFLNAVARMFGGKAKIPESVWKAINQLRP